MADRVGSAASGSDSPGSVLSSQAALGGERIHYVDWLRIGAVLLLIPFHSARLFDTLEPFYVKNAETSLVATAFMAFVTSWHMPLLFLLAGAATWFALGFRKAGQYSVERFKRLLVPFVFGVLVVVPPQMYFALRFHSNYSGSFFDYYPSFFQESPGTDYFGVGWSSAHLWFILFLFVISLVALPLLLLLRRGAGSRALDRIANFLAKPGLILLLALPLPLTSMLEDPMGHNFGLYLIVFLYGAFLMSHPKFRESTFNARWAAVILGLLSVAGYFFAALVGGATGESYAPMDFLFAFSFFFAAWFWIVAALGFGQKYLNRQNRVLRYANEAAYPFYILHQTVIIILGYYVVQWDINGAVKFAVIALGALVVSLGIYDVVIRRLDFMRFLFGMKPRKRPAAEESAAAGAKAG